jgi:DNA-binding NarL/FixJ family response regulator
MTLPPRLGLVVEDKSDTRAWLIRVLSEAFPGIDIAEVATRRLALDWIRMRIDRLSVPSEAGLHVALIDLGLPDGSGIAIIRELSERCPGVLPVVTTIYDDDAHLFDAIAAGARGYLLKDEPAELLVGYLRRIERGEPPLSPSIAHRILAHFRVRPAEPAEDAGLTTREAETLGLLAKGLTVAEAATQMGLRPQTVASYVKVIYHKLNVSTRAEATLAAVRRGLV